MSESMVEKVARAMWTSRQAYHEAKFGVRLEPYDGGISRDTPPPGILDEARAAIEAMASAADDEHLLQRINVTAYDGRFSKSGETYPVYRNFIRAFIDAALT